jgi:hypothetical protein
MRLIWFDDCDLVGYAKELLCLILLFLFWVFLLSLLFWRGCRRWLAQLYWEGVATSLATGVLQDYKIAIKLFKEAYDAGEEEAGE